MACKDADGNYVSADFSDLSSEHHQESIPEEKVCSFTVLVSFSFSCHSSDLSSESIFFIFYVRS